MIETTVIACAVVILMMTAKRMTKKETESWLADVTGSSGGTYVKVWSVKPGESETFEFDRIAFGTGEEISLRGWGFPLWSLHKHGAFLVDSAVHGSQQNHSAESPARFVTNRAWRQIAELILKARIEAGIIDSEIEKEAPEGAEDLLRWAFPNGKENKKTGMKANALFVTLTRAEVGRDGTAQTAPYSVTDFGVVDRI